MNREKHSTHADHDERDATTLPPRTQLLAGTFEVDAPLRPELPSFDDLRWPLGHCRNLLGCNGLAYWPRQTIDN
jgi:hypothetical protein